ncbi:MAG: MBL fold metallo-hydrolase [Proteobacteria bacterium]|nr:MBL fold metallo-hydrolase [Pseudomonadota bacterium]
MVEEEIADGMGKRFARGQFWTTTFADDTCLYIGAFGNVGVVETRDGLVVFDLALRLFGPHIFNEVRKFSDKPVRYIVYSHGHFDHCLGYAPFVEEIRQKGWEMPQVIAHENLVRRFEKYRMLDEHQIWSYRQQFLSVGVTPEDMEAVHETLDPTIVVRGNDSYSFSLGEFDFEIHHDKGETDDSLWMFLPEKKVLFTGDLFVSGFPNVGSPFRVQRYAKQWALADEKMLEKEAEFLVPGHGSLFRSKEKIKDVLSITAESMHFVHGEVVKRLNQGKWFEEIYHEMIDIFPDKFKNHKYLQPLYGDYRFAVRDVYRAYHGWYDSGNPTDLFPSKSSEVAGELLKVAEPENYLERAGQLVDEGKLQLALHVLDVVVKAGDVAAPEIRLKTLELKRDVLKRQATDEPSFIAMNIINSSLAQIESEIKTLKRNT